MYRFFTDFRPSVDLDPRHIFVMFRDLGFKNEPKVQEHVVKLFIVVW